MPHDDPLTATLASMPVFAGLGADALDDIARSLEPRDVKAGKTLVTQGQWGHELIVVIAGEVEIRRDHAVVAILGPGAVLGETAVLTDARRNASAVARTAVSIGTIEYSQLRALVDAIPTLAQRLDDLARDRAPE